MHYSYVVILACMLHSCHHGLEVNNNDWVLDEGGPERGPAAGEEPLVLRSEEVGNI